MGLNKIRLGDYIIRSTSNNRDLKYRVELISGVTSQGVFAIPKGDPIDVNLKPYKIVNNGAFVFDGKHMENMEYVACVMRNGLREQLDISATNLFPIKCAFEKKLRRIVDLITIPIQLGEGGKYG